VRIAAPFGVVTSALRTVEHNRAVGGVPDSYHLLGQAIDVVRRRGVSHAQIAAALTAAGFRLIESLDEGDHSHFAFGPARPQLARPAPPQLAARQPAPKPLVAADEHGTLLLDIGRDSASAGHARAGSNARRALMR
jgi:Peptidase M15